ncbi:MAG: TonB-dependent receptor [Capnocytophaga sp.]|nr:TonB-dependent receptor [Capnocytophaga sp.]
MYKHILFLLVCLFSLPLMAQVTVTGNVADEQGVPIPGANVLIKGTTKGTATDFDGNYTLEAKANDVLEISYLGYTTTELRVTNPRGGGNRLTINAVLKEDAQMLEDVVVVGHGVVKKASVTGAITSVKGSDLRMPSSSLTSAFAGQLAGVIATTSSGAPGSVSDFYIRGISTFGGRTTPLIMLDDVEISAADLNNIPAETIESFSVLKDASATAIYGSRGANGVMLIKTKTGRRNERTQIGVTFEQSFNVPVNFPNFVNGATWMELYNEALTTRNPLAAPRYSQFQIDATRAGVNPYVYPDVNWKEVIFEDYAINHRANINVSGGGDKATYYMSIQANHDEGLIKSRKLYSWDNNINNWGYNFQNNIAYNLLEGTKLELRMNTQIRQNKGGNYSPRDLFAMMHSTNPINFPVYFPEREGYEHFLFGSSVQTGNTFRTNPYATMLNSFREYRENTLNTSLKLSQDLDFITDGLSGTVLVNFKNWSSSSYNQSIQPYLYRVKDNSYDPATNTFDIERLGTGGADYITQSDITKGGDQTLVVQATIDYERQIGDHNVNAMLLYNQREYRVNILPSRNQGYSGRLMYNYANKYLAEFNFGYTGTERLKKGARFEFFPAASLGWVISDEDFYKPLSKYITFMKLRGSYGLIGSDETGLTAGAEHFLYINRIALTQTGYGYTTGENLGFTLTGPEMLNWAVENARWEKVRKLNLGVDMKLFDQINVTAEYFFDHRYDILLKREAWPQSLGYHNAKPWANKGKVDNWGGELSVDWNTRITDDLRMTLRGNFTYTQNKYVDVDDPVYKYPWQSRTNKPISHTTGYIAEGLFTSQEEIDNSPVQNLGSVPRPGDIKYRDINGDGIINDDDRTMISPYGYQPRMQYGFGFNVFYKNWDLNVFFNGSGKRTIMTGLQSPFGQTDNNVFQHIADNRWTEANPNPNAAYPRLGIQSSDTDNNSYASTYWMRDGSFLRFRTLDIGYKFKHGRVYVVGNNLALFSKFKLWDPELAWNAYPLQQVYNIGVQLTF